jgi:DNA polymerase-3 subunit delta'
LNLLPWQSSHWQHILKQSKNGTIPHAYLFNGVDGLGKTIFAQYLSNYLLCDSRNAADQPCGECKQCKLFDADTHPDYKFICPEEGSSLLKVDVIRSLVDFFNRSSMQGGKKIAVLAPAEALNHNAANALLKTLEEPASNSIIILVSHNSGQLLPTIRSRCQVMDFSIPPISLSKKWLCEQVAVSTASYSESQAEEVLMLAANAPLRALDYVEIKALDENNLMLDELGALLKKESLPNTIAERWNDDNAILRLKLMIAWVESILKIKMVNATDESEHAFKMKKYLAEKCSAQQFFSLYQSLVQQLRLLLGTSNPNKQLVFEFLLNQWSSLMSKPN